MWGNMFPSLMCVAVSPVEVMSIMGNLHHVMLPMLAAIDMKLIYCPVILSKEVSK